MKRLAFLNVVLLVGFIAPEIASAQTASRVIRLIDQRCARCHRTTAAADRAPDVEGAPEMATLRQMTPEAILQAVTTGAMRVHAEDVPDEVKRAMAEYISGRRLAPLGAGDARNMPNQCRGQKDPAYPSQTSRGAGPFGPAGDARNGWSPDLTNARFQREPGVAAAD